MSFNTPILVSSEGSYEPELYKSGFLIDADPTPEAVASALTNYSSMDNRDVVLLHEVLDLYAWEKYCNKIEKVIDDEFEE